MGSPIEVKLLANTSDLTRGTKDVEGALDKVSDSLDDIGKDGKDAGDKLGKSLDSASDSLNDLKRDSKTAGDNLEDQVGGAAKNTGRDISDLEQNFRELADTQKATSKSVADEFNVTEGQQKHLRKEAIKEIGEEAKANASETFSSFDGSASSFVDGIQGTLGGLVGSFGPVGLAAAAAGALIIGSINGALTQSNELSQEFKESVSEFAKELIKEGPKAGVSLEYIVSSLQDLATESDSSKVSLDKLFDVADKSGNSATDLANAYAGQTSGLKDLLAQQKAKLDLDQKAADYATAAVTNADDVASANSAESASLQEKAANQKEYVNYLQQAADKAKAAKKEQAEYAASGGPELEAKAKLLDQVNQAYDDGAGDVDTYIKKESGLLDTDKYIAAMQRKQKALDDYQKDLASSGLTTQAKSFLESQGADAAASLLQGYTSGSEKQKTALAKIWNEAGSSSSGAYVSKVQADLDNANWKPPKIGTPDFTEATRRIKDWAANDVTVNVVLSAKSTNGKRIL